MRKTRILSMTIVLAAYVYSIYSHVKYEKEKIANIPNLEYNFKVVSGKEVDRMLHLDGIDRNGKHKKYILDDYWGIRSNFEEGDSVIKWKGHNEVRLIKKDTTLILPLYFPKKIPCPIEMDSLMRLMKEK